ncbi:hypothetical protein HFO55_32045 [Rhizobium leguminosarum]|uniref:effector-associated domain EAD1-containing protein n=1 Tax=Rhizobium leguminosarum TaxID=384 RepID=UPI001D982D7A|nr:effector-associated domain EAD1-containing protein [Rhizobium leguminosarum]MBY5571776.1 hypothetical protein [Rhizobium leguminosarum]MBY5578313.1 hypothetical protein [Rhizobium leguminosarum]
MEDVLLPQDNERPVGSPGLVAALLSDGAGPVVWAQETGFEKAITNLWRNLWPEARSRLSFRLAFSPQDIVNQPPTIVATLPALAPRWANFRVVSAKTPVADEASSLLLGEAEGEPIRSLIARLGVALSTISDVRKVVEVSKALQGGGDLTNDLAALRLICHLSPEQTFANDEKNVLLQRCAANFASASIAQVRMARNLDLSAISNSKPLWLAVQSWSYSKLWDTGDAQQIARVLNECLSTSGPVKAWRDAVRGGLDDLTQSDGARNVKKLWPVLQEAPDLLKPMFSHSARKDSLEIALSNSAPQKLSSDVGVKLLEAARDMALVQLHAVCCAAVYNPGRATNQHMQDMAFTDASLGRVLKNATPKQLIEVALAHEDRFLYAQAARACAADTSLLGQLDVQQAGWRRLWREAVQLNAKAWDGPQDAIGSMAALMDTMLDLQLRDEPFVAAVSSTPLANLFGYSRRADVWSVIPGSSLPAYLSATADAWIKAFKQAPIEQAPEPELAKSIEQSDRSSQLLEYLAATPTAGCVFFRLFPNLDERNFMRWTTKVLKSERLSESEAEALGLLIAARSWSEAANGLADQVIDGREDLRPSLNYCIELVGRIRQYQVDMFFGSATGFAKWRTLEEVATQLYGYGPGAEKLWHRAGGKEGDIPQTHTGVEAWRSVIGDAERGKQKVNISKLISVMYEDYPGNRTLQKMRNDSFFR